MKLTNEVQEGTKTQKPELGELSTQYHNINFVPRVIYTHPSSHFRFSTATGYL